MPCDVGLDELYDAVRRAVSGFLPQLGRIEVKGAYVFGKNYDRLKYRVAKAVAEILSKTGCLSEIYYADISSGEYITGQTYFGRDVDIILLPRDRAAKDKIKALLPQIEKTINNAVADAIGNNRRYKALKEIARTNGVVEFHIDDTYSREIQTKKKKGTLSDTNAIKIYP